jgi:hypothetical protein
MEDISQESGVRSSPQTLGPQVIFINKGVDCYLEGVAHGVSLPDFEENGLVASLHIF